MSLIFTQPVQREILNSATASGGVLDTAKMDLFTNNVSPTAQSLLADFTIASFTGYAQADITWGTAYNNSDSEAEIDGSTCQFTFTDTTPVTCYGYIVTAVNPVTPSLTELVYAEAFASPVNLAVTDDAVVVVPRVTLENSD